MKHTSIVPHFQGPPAQLAEEIGDLYYDALADLLRLLVRKIEADGQADHGRGRVKLARELAACAAHLDAAAGHIDEAWRICAPHVAAGRR